MTVFAASGKISGTPRRLTRPALFALRRQLRSSISDEGTIARRQKVAQVLPVASDQLSIAKEKYSQGLLLVWLFYI